MTKKSLIIFAATALLALALGACSAGVGEDTVYLPGGFNANSAGQNVNPDAVEPGAGNQYGQNEPAPQAEDASQAQDAPAADASGPAAAGPDADVAPEAYDNGQGIGATQGNGRGQGNSQSNGQGNSQADAYAQPEGDALSQGQGQGNGKRYGQSGGGQGQGGQGQGGGYNTSSQPLSEAEADALVRAIEEEFGAQALYQSILDAFGDVAPFNSIVQSEAMHAQSLINLAQRYGIAIPEFPSTTNLPTFSSLEEACAAGVQAELVDAALYDELMPLTTHPDILQVYSNLQSASLNNHLPAFEACQ